MAIWIFKKEFDNDNPICYDLGNIEKVILDKNDEGAEIRCVDKIIADGKQFQNGGGKRYFSLICGWSNIFQIEDEQWESDTDLKLEKEPKDGDQINMEGKFRLKYNNRSYHPICCDKRLLYILDRNWEMNIGEKPDGGLTNADWERFCNDIPTLEQAEKWLKRKQYQSEPVPFESLESKAAYKRIDPCGGLRPGVKALEFLN